MTRQVIKQAIAIAIDEKRKHIVISGNFGCGLEFFNITIDHKEKKMYCDEFLPICVLNDIRNSGYIDMGGMKYN